jgi:hypothetical protein
MMNTLNLVLKRKVTKHNSLKPNKLREMSEGERKRERDSN